MDTDAFTIPVQVIAPDAIDASDNGLEYILQEIQEQAESLDIADFLHYVNDKYSPADRKIEIDEDMIQPQNIKHTIIVNFSEIFHPDKNIGASQETKLICAKIMTHLDQQ